MNATTIPAAPDHGEIEKLRGLLAKQAHLLPLQAMPAHWGKSEVVSFRRRDGSTATINGHEFTRICPYIDMDVADLVTEAVNALPRLLDHLDQLGREVAEVTEERDGWEKAFQAMKKANASVVGLANRNNDARLAAEARAAAAEGERDGLNELMAWFGSQHRLALDYYSPVYGDDDDQATEWRVTKESGPINDREWDIVGRGETPLAALIAARAALAPGGCAEG